MQNGKPRVTIHMVASLDGFIARRDGGVDWLETSDNFEGGATMTPETVDVFLQAIDCYVMGSRTYETALGFEAKGLGWSYGDKPTVVLTRRTLRKTRNSVEFYAGDLGRLVDERLKPMYAKNRAGAWQRRRQCETRARAGDQTRTLSYNVKHFTRCQFVPPSWDQSQNRG